MTTPVKYFTGPAHGARVTSPFGMRNDPMNPGNQRMHNGTDFGGKPRGHVWTSPYPGVVTYVGTQGGRGLVVAIKVGSTLHIFQHLDKALVKKGDQVNTGTPIGTNGTTGDVTGPHLHYEIRVDNGSTLGSPVWGDPANFNFGGTGNMKTYTVVRGDTLYDIAKKFGVTVEDLRKWNNRTSAQDRNLEIGTVLIVSEPVNTGGVSQADHDALEKRVEALEKKLANVKKAL
ncbi:MAG: LysM peptidoglycan-binding domain-containing protein [Firmicutes bacterium]|nr:LysM peptidoglycan-binding domain-containing protein [Bacillota bacterium]